MRICVRPVALALALLSALPGCADGPEDSAVPTTCGNEEVDEGEECDDGNEEDLDGCSNRCELSEDLCEDVTCDSRLGTCEGDLALPARSQGRCGVDEGEAVCDYGGIADEIDCAAEDNGHFCLDGFCENGVVAIDGRAGSLGEQAGVLMSDGTLLTFSDADFTSSPLTDVVDFSLAQQYWCALRENGEVYCVGENAYGQLGTGNTEPAVGLNKLPIASSVSVVDLACTTRFSAVLTSTGDVLVWGEVYGSFVDGAVVATGVDALGQGEVGIGLLAGTTLTMLGDGGLGVPQDASYSDRDIVFSSGGVDTTGGIRGSGQVWHLGRDGGRVGNGPSAAPHTGGTIIDVIGLTDAVDVSHGSWNRCALRSTGEGLCWAIGGTPTTINMPSSRVIDIEVVDGVRQILMLDEEGRMFANRSGAVVELDVPGGR